MTRTDAIAHPVSASSWRNLPNLLTLLRLVLVVPFAVALLWEDGTSVPARIIATVIFAVASFTDYVDGYLARKNNLVTTFGKIADPKRSKAAPDLTTTPNLLADPIADKLLTGMALVGLSVLGQLSWWVTIVILGREILVTLMRFWVIRDGVMAASRGGKAKTVVQILAIMLYLLPLTGAAHTVATWVMGAAVVLTLVTGVDYAVRAWRLRAAGVARQEAES